MPISILKRSIPDGQDSRVTKNLLDNSWIQTVKFCKNFHKQVGDDEMPMRYSEVSSRFAYLMGLSKAGAWVLPEVPAGRLDEPEDRRRRPGPDRYGRGDIWAVYNATKSICYYIEVKKCWFSLTHGRHDSQKLENSWDQLISQRNSLARWISTEDQYDVWVGAAMFVVTYKNSTQPILPSGIKSEWREEFMKSRPFNESNWAGEWSVGKEIASFSYTDLDGNEKHTYQPNVFLLCNFKRFSNIEGR